MAYVSLLGADEARADIFARADGLAVQIDPRYWAADQESIMEADCAPRYAAQQTLEVLRSSRYNTDEFIRNVAPRYSALNTFEVDCATRYRANPARDPETGEDPVEVAIHEGLGVLSCDLAVRGPGGMRDIENHGNLVITLKESEPIEWSIPIFGRHEQHPLAPGYWNGWYDCDAVDGGTAPSYLFTVEKEFLATIGWSGQEFVLRGIPDAWSVQRNWMDGLRMKLDYKGHDHSWGLFRDDMTMRTARSSLRRTVSAKSEIISILNRFGRNLNHHLKFTDYPIAVQHRQAGRPIDWIQEILAVSMAEWRIEGKTFMAYEPQLKTYSSADWKYTSSSAVMEESEDASATRIINDVTIRRLAETQKRMTMEVDTFQQYTYNFPEPIYQARFRRLHESFGVFSDFIWRDPGGNVIKVTDIRSDSNNITWPDALLGYPVNNAASVTFTWGVRAGGWLMLGAPGQIEFLGHPGYRQQDLDTRFDSDFKVRAVDTASIAKYGRRPIELPLNGLIATKSVAQRFANRYLERVGRQRRRATVRVPLNLDMRPGDTVGENDLMLDLQRARLVTEVEHSISPNPAERYTRYTGYEYVT